MSRADEKRKHRERIKVIRKKKRNIFLVFLVGVAAVLAFVFWPRLELVGHSEVALPYNQRFKDPGVKLNSQEKGERLSIADYDTEGRTNPAKPGKYKITYSYTFLGIRSSVSRTVIVKKQQDREGPKITLKGDASMTLPLGTPYEEPGAEVADNEDKKAQDRLKISGSVDVNTPGTYTITYEDTDEADNISKVTREVIVANGIIYLTFDDGPNDEVTPQVLQILKDENVKATFFVTGNGSDEVLKQTFDAGNAIGLHTFTHDYKSIYASADAYFQDLSQIAERVKRVTGTESHLVRFPGGSSNTISAQYAPGLMSALVNEVQNRGYQYFDWNVSSGDGSQQSAPEIPYQNVTTALMPGQDNVVLMHDTKQNSANALKGIIDFGKQQGYGFKTLSEDSFPAHHSVNN